MISKGLHGVMVRSLECVFIPYSISVALKGSQVSPKVTCSYISTYMYQVAMLNGIEQFENENIVPAMMLAN